MSNLPNIDLPKISTPELHSMHFSNPKLADHQYEIVMEEIQAFQNNLDNEHEVGIQLASFGQNIIINVTDIGYSNPDLFHFYGFVNGNPAELIQHQNQLNFLLMAVKKADPEKPARRIGFAT